MRVPIEVRGTGADGNPMEEKTHTGVVSELGAMVRTSRMFQIGTKVVVTNRFSQQTAQFRVVWVKDYQEGDYWEIGIEAVQPLNDFLGRAIQPPVRFTLTPHSTPALMVLYFRQVGAVLERYNDPICLPPSTVPTGGKSWKSPNRWPLRCF